MKLVTSIRPRLDGTVILDGLDGVAYVFAPDGYGELTAEVPHAATAQMALGSGNFYPAGADAAPGSAEVAQPAPGNRPRRIKAESKDGGKD